MSDAPTPPATPAAVPVRKYGGQHGYGFKPPTKDRTKGPIEHLLSAPKASAPGATTDSASLEQYITGPGGIGIHDQGQTSSCVGFAFAESIGIRLLVLGQYTTFPSPLAVYVCARAEERKDPSSGMTADTPLQDQGSDPGLAVEGLQEYGIPSNVAWPFDAAKINDEPTWSELEAASTYLVDGAYAVTQTGADYATAVRQAIAAGYPVPIAAQVDQAFEDYAGASAPPITAPDPNGILGGHMLSAVGYKPDPNKAGAYLYRVLNHWSASWGDGGLCWCDEAWLLSTSNAVAIELVPAPAAA